MASLLAQMVKNPPEMQKTWVQSLGSEDSLEEGMDGGTHSSILAWRIPIDRGAWWAAVHRVTKSDMTERLSAHTHKKLPFARYSIKDCHCYCQTVTLTILQNKFCPLQLTDMETETQGG